ncbi:MAG: hypothetical protein ACLPOO_09325 [Terriglobales bacterium]
MIDDESSGRAMQTKASAISVGPSDATSKDPSEELERHDHTLVQKQVHRRSFIRTAALGAVGAASVGVTYMSSSYNAGKLIVGLCEYVHDTDNKLLLQLLGPGDSPSTALIPAGNHTWMKPPEGTYWYSLDASCAEAYRERFLRTSTFRKIQGFPNAGPEDSLGLFGSQTSNLGTRILLGNPFRDRPSFDVARPGWRTRLHWNLHASAGLGTTERKQFGVLWREPNYHMVGSDGKVFEPRAGIDWVEDDYLLITVLPRYSKGPQRILVFAGCHGEGTLGAAKLLADPPLRELRKLDKRLHGEPWYQALFHVEVKRTADGEFRPHALELVEAAPLPLRYRAA